MMQTNRVIVDMPTVNVYRTQKVLHLRLAISLSFSLICFHISLMEAFYSVIHGSCHFQINLVVLRLYLEEMEKNLMKPHSNQK